MCEPVSLSSGLMFAASMAVNTVSQFAQQQAQAQAAAQQAEVQAYNNAMIRQSSIKAMVESTNDLNVRQEQERVSTALNIQQNKLAAERAQSTALASSESSGLSMDMLMADFDRQYMGYADSQMQQLGWTEDQMAREREGIRAQAESRMKSGYDTTPIQRPSFGASAIRLAAAGLTSYGTYATRDPSTGKLTLQ